MKILYVTPDFQHPLVPGSHRHYHFIKELSKRHEIVWLTLARDAVPQQANDEMRSYTRDMKVFGYEGGQSSASKKSRERQRREAVARLSLAFKEALERGRPDVVLFHGQRLHPLLDSCTIPVVIDMCDANSMRVLMQARYESALRFPVNMMRYFKMSHLERQVLRRSRHVAFISARDRDAVVGKSSDIQIVPNGVDADFWAPGDKAAHSNTIALTGEMSYPPNTDAALVLIDKIMPILRRELENPQVLLIGRAPPASLIEAARRHQDVTVTGFVEDVRPWIQKASLFAAPIRFASGMQNKVLEAMAMKLPVVTTPVVAEGMQIDAPDENPAVVVDIREARVFADAIVRLLRSPRECLALGEDGRNYVMQNFSWVSSARKFEKMCLNAIG